MIRLSLSMFSLSVVASAATGAKIDFRADVQPLIEKRCIMCHGPEQQMNSFRLDRRSAAMRGGTRSVIVPGSSGTSRLYLRLVGDNFGKRMPATGALPPDEIAVFKAWIDQGAKWPDELANEPVLTPADARAVAIADSLRRGQMPEFEAKTVNLRGPGGSTPFMFAVLYSDAATVTRLLEMGADANSHNDAGATPLMWAVDDLAKTKVLLKHGANVNAVSNDGRTPLAIAAALPNSQPVVKLLLSDGADANRGGSPLREAAVGGNPETMQMLMEHGANVKTAGAGALAGALERKCYVCADLLAKSLDKKAFTDALLALAVYSDKNAIQYVVDHGADVNAADVDGRTPLMYAANSDRLGQATVQLLVEHGANVKGALAPALLHGRSPVADYLAKAGAADDEPALPVLQFVKNNNAAAAIARAIPGMQKADLAFTQKSGCVSCHNEALTEMALSAAHTAGAPVDPLLEKREVKSVITFFSEWRERLLQGMAPGGPAYMLEGLHAENYPADLTTDAIARYIRLKQFADGHWDVGCGGSRNPLCGDEITNTANSLRALQFYAPNSSEPVERAAKWLASAPVYTHEDRTFRVFGLAWAGGNADALAKAKTELLAEQRADGGWSDNPYMPSTSYATGEAMVALHDAGIPVSDAAYQRGLKFLLNTQTEDGSWYVRTHSFGTQPYFDAGFPHGVDQWISAAGTNWAVMALAAR